MKKNKEVKEVRVDFKVDFFHLQHLAKSLQDKMYSYKRKLSDKNDKIEKRLRADMLNYFNLLQEKAAIDSINEKIKALEEEREVYEDKIRSVTQGDKKNRYGSCEAIGNGSEADIWIKSHLVDPSNSSDKIRDMIDDCVESIYLSSSSEEAIRKYEKCIAELEHLIQINNEEDK